MTAEKIKSLLKIAIQAEENAYTLYVNASAAVENRAAKVMLNELANDELEHKRILKEYESGKRAITTGPEPIDLQIAEYIEDRPLGPDATPQEVIVFAMKKEKQAYEFYRSLSAKVSDNGLKEVLEKLSRQELGHKTKLEKEYDDMFMPEN